MTLPGRRLCAALALLVSSLAPAAARGQGWVVEASAGGTDPRSVTADVGSRSAILGVRREAPVWLYLSGAVPLDSTGLPWAAAGGGGRLERPLDLASPVALSFGIDLAGHGHAYRERLLGAVGSGLTLAGLPFVALSRGDARLEVHAGGQSYTSTFRDSTSTRAVLDAGARVGFAPDPRVSLSAATRWLRAEEGGFPYAGVEAGWADGGLAGWAYAGRWLSDLIPTPVWGVGGSLEVAGGVGVRADFQQEAADPLYWNLPRRFWSVGLSRAFGAARPPAPAVAPVLPEVVDGRVRIRVPLDEAGSAPAVAGDFNDWKPAPMRRNGDHWEIELALNPGVYHYSVRRADGSWFVPESVANRVDDGFGGKNAVLIVPAS